MSTDRMGDTGMQGAAPHRIAFICSGQGSQKVGMGIDFAAHSERARELFDIATDESGFDVAALSAQGPAEKLADTRYTQPALVTTSLAAAAVLADAGIEPDCVAGFSLGEYAAHGIAGSMDVRDALRLVALRGRLMSEVGKSTPGGMLALIKASPKDAQDVCDRCACGEVLEVANLNCPGQVVISGAVDAIARASKDWPEHGGRAIPVKTSGAFHSSLMKDVAGEISRELGKVAFHDARIPLYCNVDALPLKTGCAVEKLTAQMYSPVRWEETVRNMAADGVDTFLELGPGGVLCGMVKRIVPDATRIQVGTYEEALLAIETLSGKDE